LEEWICRLFFMRFLNAKYNATLSAKSQIKRETKTARNGPHLHITVQKLGK
jgi:hypothetical protein